MSDALKPWTPDQPLRADATDKQLRVRAWWMTEHTSSDPSYPGARIQLAREFAAACMEAFRRDNLSKTGILNTASLRAPLASPGAGTGEPTPDAWGVEWTVCGERQLAPAIDLDEAAGIEHCRRMTLLDPDDKPCLVPLYRAAPRSAAPEPHIIARNEDGTAKPISAELSEAVGAAQKFVMDGERRRFSEPSAPGAADRETIRHAANVLHQASEYELADALDKIAARSAPTTEGQP